jgi:glycosyltransferase involved in cell wall biosynthesis
MKICFVSSGTFEHVQPYINYFKDLGHEIYFVALSPSPDRGVKIIPAYIGKGEKYNIDTQKWKYIFSAFKARTAVKKIQPDIVHAHYATSGGFATLLINHPNTILTVHGSDVNEAIKSPYWKILLKIIFRRCKFITVVSQELEQKVLSLGIDKIKIKNINIGIDFDKFYYKRGNREYSGKLKIICNRSFKPVYDHETLLKGLLLLRGKVNYHLTLLGDGPLKDKLIQFVNDNGLESYVSFYGRIPNEKQIDIFRKNNIYISSSKSDGTSLSLLEAMAAGLFPIVTDIPGNKFWISNKFNGLLFPVGNFRLLADCIEKVSLNNDLIQGSITSNQQLIRLKGNREVNMNEIEGLYFQLIKAQHRI